MSLDNVLAIAAAAQGNTGLIVFGLAISHSADRGRRDADHGAADRFPILVWAGAALLGWIAGELIVDDRQPALLWLQHWSAALIVPDAQATGDHAGGSMRCSVAAAGAAIVLAGAGCVQWRSAETPAMPGRIGAAE